MQALVERHQRGEVRMVTLAKQVLILCIACTCFAGDQSRLLESWQKANSGVIPGRYNFTLTVRRPFSAKDKEVFIGSMLSLHRDLRSRGVPVSLDDKEIRKTTELGVEEFVKKGYREDIWRYEFIFLDQQNFVAKHWIEQPDYVEKKWEFPPVRMERHGDIVAIIAGSIPSLYVYDASLFREQPGGEAGMIGAYTVNMGLSELLLWMRSFPFPSHSLEVMPWDTAQVSTHEVGGKMRTVATTNTLWGQLVFECDPAHELLPVRITGPISAFLTDEKILRANIESSKSRAPSVVTPEEINVTEMKEIQAGIWKPTSWERVQRLFTKEGSEIILLSTFHFSMIDCSTPIKDTDLAMSIAGVDALVDLRFDGLRSTVYDITRLEPSQIRTHFFRKLSPEEMEDMRREIANPLPLQPKPLAVATAVRRHRAAWWLGGAIVLCAAVAVFFFLQRMRKGTL